jgi:TolB-like protein
MKKLGFMAGLCILGSLVFGQTVSLDEAIVAAVADIEGSLARGTKVAVLNFTSDAERFSDYVIGELAGALVSGNKLVVVNRQNIDLIRKEMDIQLSGDVSDESAQRIGKQLGVQSIVSGSLINTGAWFRFRVNTINVETAQQQVFTSKNINGSDAQVVFLLTGERVAPAATAATAPTTAPVASSLKIGTWKLSGSDSAHTIWSADLVIQSYRNSAFIGYFDWYSGVNETYRGREYFEGSYNELRQLVILRGTRLERAPGLGLGVYQARLTGDGMKLANGSWAEGVPGTWEAEWIKE